MIVNNGQLVFYVRSATEFGQLLPSLPVVQLRKEGSVVGSVTNTNFDFRNLQNSDIWVHFAVFRRGNTLGLRVNNFETKETFAGEVGASSTNLTIGSTALDTEQWRGWLDEVGLWRRALGDAELTALYNGGNGRTLP